MPLKKLTVILLASLGVITTSYTNATVINYETGLVENDPDFDTVMKLKEEAAKKGDLDAQADLGAAYHQLGNQKQALYWSEKAAKKGHIFAQANLALIYLAQKNYKQAEHWAKKAADQNNQSAQLTIGSIYAYNKDFKKAVAYWEKATLGENAYVAIDAYYQLFLAYYAPEFLFLSEALKPNLDKAQYYLEQAAKLDINNTHPQVTIGVLLQILQHSSNVPDELINQFKKVTESNTAKRSVRLLTSFGLATYYNRIGNKIEEDKYFNLHLSMLSAEEKEFLELFQGRRDMIYFFTFLDFYKEGAWWVNRE